MSIKYSLFRLTGILLSSLSLFASAALAQTVYVENFDAAPSSIGGAFSVSIGGDADGVGVNNKEVVMGQWGLTPSGSFAGSNLQPQTADLNVRFAGVFLDSTVMTAGAGTYTLEFDIVGDTVTVSPGDANVYVLQGSGYDASNFLVLDLAETVFLGPDTLYPSDGTGFPNTPSGSATVSPEFASLSIANTSLSQSNVKLDFVYDGTGTIVIAFGGYKTAVAFDNISIYKSSPSGTAAYTIYGTGFTDFDGGTGVLNEFQGGVGDFAIGGTPGVGKELNPLVPQWGITGNGLFTGTVLRPQKNPAANVKLACIFLTPEYFKMGSGTYTVSCELTGDPAGNAAYRAYVWKDSSGGLISMDVSANGFGGLTGLTPSGSLLVEQDLSYQANLSGTVDVSIPFTYTDGDVICFAIGGYQNASTIDNLKVTTTMAPPGAVMYSTDFSNFTTATEEAPLGDFKTDFNIIYGSEVPIDILGTAVNGSGDFILDFAGFPSSSEIYEVLTSTDLGFFSALTTPLIATTDASGIGQVVIPASEVGPKQFFQIDDQFNAKLVDSAVWGISGNGNDFADGIARPQGNPATNVKMMGLFLDSSVFTSGAGNYTVSFELSGDVAGNTAYRAYAYNGSGYDLTGMGAGRLNLSLSAGGFGGYTGLTGLEGASASQLALVTTIDNGTDLNNAAKTDATRMISFDFFWDGTSTSAIAIAIGGYNNASTIDNFFVTYIAP